MSSIYMNERPSRLHSFMTCCQGDSLVCHSRVRISFKTNTPHFFLRPCQVFLQDLHEFSNTKILCSLDQDGRRLMPVIYKPSVIIPCGYTSIEVYTLHKKNVLKIYYNFRSSVYKSLQVFHHTLGPEESEPLCTHGISNAPSLCLKLYQT